MDYKPDLRSLNMGELKDELFAKVATQHTIDQEKVKISELINAVLQKQNKAENVYPKFGREAILDRS